MEPEDVFLKTGRIVSLHIHPQRGGAAMEAVQSITMVADRGIEEDSRYFQKRTRRQVTLIAREEIQEHAEALGAGDFPAGIVRSNIETIGLDLCDYIGHELAVGTAVLAVYAPRTPCAQMDAICQGLRERMGDSRQGVLTQIKISGTASIGDEIRPIHVKQSAGSAS